jgi:hypothetical protein
MIRTILINRHVAADPAWLFRPEGDGSAAISGPHLSFGANRRSYETVGERLW